MSAPLSIPFEWNPFSTTIKTGTYTVPAGFRARVRPTSLETDFTIDAVIAVEKTKWIGSISSTTIFTNTSPYMLGGGVSNASGASEVWWVSHASVNDNNPYGATGNAFSLSNSTSNRTAASATQPLSCMVPPDNIIRASNSGLKYYALQAVNDFMCDWFWVPADTDLDGSRYVVELYSNIA